MFDFLHLICATVIGAIVLTFRFNIDTVVTIVWSIMIIINFVLTFRFLTTCLSHDREPARNKGCVQPHLFASYLRLRVGLVGGEYAYWLL